MKKILSIVRHTLFVILMTMSAMQISGCNGHDTITSVSAPEFDKAIKADTILLLDVRTCLLYTSDAADE